MTSGRGVESDSFLLNKSSGIVRGDESNFLRRLEKHQKMFANSSENWFWDVFWSIFNVFTPFGPKDFGL